MNETERAWARMKTVAQKFAAMGRMLDPRHAEDVVSKIIREERAERPPGEALRYLARELRGFIAQYEQDGTQSADERERTKSGQSASVGRHNASQS